MSATCPACDSPLPSSAPGGFCPACLMGEAVDSLDTVPGDSDPSEAPTVVERPLGSDPLEGSTLGIGGRYKILQRIGEGGFGTVFMAEQSIPVRRRVALKVLKAGMDTRQVVARFEAERQALAMMDHPNIAKIYDGGETEQGRSYFVMELVRGTPITAFCDREHLDPKARLHLFLQVCRAVQHAHQKGIIHRDLKPGNILITIEDGAEPVPKVIDFGVAKAMEANLTDKTLFTRFEQMIGTPAYMSPEQAGTDAARDVDTWMSGSELLNYALCCLMAEDRESYESVSAGMLNRFADSENARELATATYTYLLMDREKDPARLSQALAMAEKVYQMRRIFWDALSVAMAEFRLENFERSRTFFTISEKGAGRGNCATIAAAFLAMEAARRGDLTSSAEHLARARTTHEGNLAQVPGPHDLGREWYDLTACRIVIQQADEALAVARKLHDR